MNEWDFASGVTIGDYKKMPSNKTGATYERELANRLDNEGWFVMRSAGSGNLGDENADIIALKDDMVYIFECKSYHPDNLPLDVSDDSEQLGKIRSKIKPTLTQYGSDTKKECFFAVREKGTSSWRWFPWSTKKIEDVKDGGFFYRLLGEEDE